MTELIFYVALGVMILVLKDLKIFFSFLGYVQMGMILVIGQTCPSICKMGDPSYAVNKKYGYLMHLNDDMLELNINFK